MEGRPFGLRGVWVSQVLTRVQTAYRGERGRKEWSNYCGGCGSKDLSLYPEQELRRKRE